MRFRHPQKRGLLLVVGALSISVVFVSGYAAGGRRGESAPRSAIVRTVALRGTSVAPRARATLEVLRARDGNRPLTLSVVGLPKLPPRRYYEVDLVHGGKPWESCGAFRVASAFHAVTLTLNASLALQKGDTWVVTRQAQDREGGVIALRQA